MFKKLFFIGLMAALMPTLARAEIAVALNADDATVSLIDTTTYKEIQQIPVGKEPHHLMPTPDDKELLVASALSNPARRRSSVMKTRHQVLPDFG